MAPNSKEEIGFEADLGKSPEISRRITTPGSERT